MKKAIYRRTFHCAIMLLFSSLLSCDNSGNSTVDESALEAIDLKLDEADSKRAVLVESIIRSSPTLAQTGEIFAEVGNNFNRDYLNDLDVTNYTTLKAQGINLGIYLADLGYITTFEQSQEVIFYMNSAQKMAESIGVSDVFNESTIERMEMNINDKDSLISLISELYWKTDAFLKDLNRENISALIICGGWIEGMHIGSRLLTDGYNSDIIYVKILGQHNNLKKIISLLETFEGEENIDVFEARLKEIEVEYANVLQSHDGSTISEESKVTLRSVMDKIETFRNEINKG